MKKTVPLIIISTLFFGSVGLPAKASWKRYLSRDRTFSFQYPDGWAVNETESAIEIKETERHQQILIMAMPRQSGKNTLIQAKEMVRLFKKNMPDLKAEDFQERGEHSVYFTTRFSEGGNDFQGDVLVISDNDQTVWFSFSGPTRQYRRSEAVDTLTAVIKSLKGADPPHERGTQTVKNATLEKNSRAFIFVLEFALGAPLNFREETIILEELMAGWRNKGVSELEKYNAYPQFVQLILSSGQHRLEQIRQELAQSIRQWLTESPASDPAVKAIREQLEKQSRTVVPGKPALTEMSATAYSELMAFSRLLHQNSTATAEQISPAAVKEIRNNLIMNWNRLSTDEQQDVLTTPGLWITIRTLLSYGTKEEQSVIRSSLIRLHPADNSMKRSSPSRENSKPRGILSHYALTEMNRMTFNTYMWSRGFRKTTLGY